MNDRWRQIHELKYPNFPKKYDRIIFGYDFGIHEASIMTTIGVKGDKIYVLKVEEI